MSLSDIDVAVIGAGAAGLAATRRLQAAHVSVAAFEGRGRIGGRAHTVHERYHIDLGCEWLHSADRNAWAKIGEHHGFTIDRTRPPWRRQSGNQGFSPEEQAAFNEALEKFEQGVEQAATQAGDEPASTFLPGGRWNGLIEAIGGFMSGARLDEVSAKDYARYEDTETNWRVREGYGALITAYGTDLPVFLNAEVSRIDHGGERIVIQTTRGTVTARAVVIALPTSVLAREAVIFSPALPEKLEAAAHLPLGDAEKVFFELSEPEAFPSEGHLFGALTAKTGSYHLRPMGRPIIEGFFAGSSARALKVLSFADREEYAMEELVGLLGSDVRKQLAPLAVSDWANDPMSGGAYSYAETGYADCRAVLAAPIAQRLFFAGEATSPNFFTTAHGAYESGIRAAEEALAALS